MQRSEYPESVRKALETCHTLEHALHMLEAQGEPAELLSDVFKTETRERLIAKYRTDKDRLQEALASNYPPVQNGPATNY